MLLVSSLFKEQETILVLSGIGRWYIRFRMLVLWVGCLGYSSPGSSLSCPHCINIGVAGTDGHSGAPLMSHLVA